MLTSELEEKYTRLRDLIRACESVLVAYSGGVDSALVMATATGTWATSVS
jgi:PP-loop superfamily ATP-utilizing enzyme